MQKKTEHLSLKWDEFGENARATFAQLRDDQDFTDVTLVCEDGDHQIGAHKVVLASASPVFSNLLRNNPHPRPLIFMKGLKSEELMAIVDFLYYGQTKVAQTNLATFLALAAELQLKGLAGVKGRNENEKEVEAVKNDVEEDEREEVRSKTNAIVEADHEQRDISSNSGKSENEILNSHFEPTVYNQYEYTDSTSSSFDLEKFHQHVESMMSKKLDTFLYGSKLAWACNLCGKEATQGQIRRHIESKHITGVRHKCDLCHKTSKSRYALEVHKKRNHLS